MDMNVTGRTREHLAWIELKTRIDHLNSFAGNRSEMAKFTKEVEKAWERAGELSPLRVTDRGEHHD